MEFTKEVFDLSGRSAAETASLFARHQIGLTEEEGRHLQESILGRAPSLAELVLFSIEGSEHCSYKSSRPYLSKFVTDGPEVVLGAKEDAGIIRVARDRSGRGFCVVMSHESHNHPSQVVPYEGAATGVGGNVRDVCCMGAQVIALADDLRFGSLDSPKTKWLFEQVVSGIAGYGNPIGVPSLAGGLQFDPGYQDNCLVTVVSLGILTEDAVIHSYAPDDSDGYRLILAGKPTDNSGFGGASFASFELEEEKHEQNKGAVQEPNAFLGRHMIQASAELFSILSERGLTGRVGFKDLGAGGIACASVEIADTNGFGAEVDLDSVHVGMEDLPAHVVLCAETQERYLWAVPEELTDLVLDHYNKRFDLPGVSRGACARVIGRITKEPRYVVRSRGEVIVDAPAAEVTRGFLYHRPVGSRNHGADAEINGAEPGDYAEALLAVLSHENVASKHRIFDCYDKQVQGRTVTEAGAADAGILTPFNSSSWPEEIRSTGITLTTDQNPRFNRIDPYLGAMLAVTEAVTNTVAVGAVPAAISDCLCYGNPEKPDQMAEFAAGCQAVADTAGSLSVPVIAGNVSLYNESKGASIPPSPMIACLGTMADASRRIPGDFRIPGSRVYLLPVSSRRGLQGSIYAETAGISGGALPDCDLEMLKPWIRTVTEAAEAGLISSCRDLSEGGIAAAAARMTFRHAVGCSLRLPGTQRHDEELFGEGPGFLAEVTEAHRQAFLDLCSRRGCTPLELGSTTEAAVITIGSLTVDTESARRMWENGLDRRFA